MHKQQNVRDGLCLQIRPSKLPWPQLYELQGAAEFVANAITYEPLENELHMPEHLCSPQSTLAFQAGDSFDMSVLLASILIGAGFDAYVIVGYAPPEVVHNDQSKGICPLLEDEQAELSAQRATFAANSGDAAPEDNAGAQATANKFTCACPTDAVPACVFCRHGLRSEGQRGACSSSTKTSSFKALHQQCNIFLHVQGQAGGSAGEQVLERS